jgi:ABC-2 type transport system permease protein
MDTIYILWLRQIIKYFRSKSRIIGSLAQPLLFLAAFGFGFGGIYQKAGQGNYIQFLVPGIISMSVLFQAIFSGVDIIWDRQFGFLKETLVAPVSRLEIILGKVLGGATVASIQGLIIFIITFIFGFRPVNIYSIPLTIMFMFLISILFASMGTIIASLMDDMQGFQLIMNFLIMPIMFLSGAFFPLTGLPKVVEIITKIDPLTYGVDAMRGVLIGVSNFGITTDLIVLLAISSILLFIGAKLFNRLQA